jgi:hypothetical protein
MFGSVMAIATIAVLATMGAPVRATEIDDDRTCEVLLGVEHFPAGWGLDSREVAEMANRPELRAQLEELGHVARFLGDPENIQLFDSLGLIYNVGYNQETMANPPFKEKMADTNAWADRLIANGVPIEHVAHIRAFDQDEHAKKTDIFFASLGMSNERGIRKIIGVSGLRFKYWARSGSLFEQARIEFG